MLITLDVTLAIDLLICIPVSIIVSINLGFLALYSWFLKPLIIVISPNSYNDIMATFARPHAPSRMNRTRNRYANWSGLMGMDML